MDRGDHMEPDAAKAWVCRYFLRLLNERDLSVCDELLSADYVDHDAPPDAPPGPRGTQAFVAGFLAQYPDLRVEIEDILAEGDRVAARLVWRGHHGVTGEPLRQMGIIILRLNERGQLAERWSAYRTL